LRARIVSVNPVKISLEDYFLSQVENRNGRLETGNCKLGTGDSKLEIRSSASASGDSKPGAPRLRFESRAPAEPPDRVQPEDWGPVPGVDGPHLAGGETPLANAKLTGANEKPVSSFQFPVSKFQFPISNFQSRTLASAQRVLAIASHNFKES